MTQAISIHIGLNGVDPSAYQGWPGTLAGCVNDALAMRKIAQSMDYLPILITDADATADRVISEIGQAAWNLDDNGILLLTYSGHGGQMKDVNGDESDGKDETWVLYDRQLIDDELTNLWSQFSAGARIVVLSDSCHSGTVTRGTEYAAIVTSDAFSRHYRSRSGPPRFRGIPADVAAANYENNAAKYNALQFASGSRTRGTMGASVLLISGCQDNQLSNDGDVNGLFTGTLMQVWDDGSFSGDYRAFCQAIIDQMPATQTPNYYVVGASNPAFEAQSPFTTEAPSTSTGSSTQPSTSTSAWPSIKGPTTVLRSAGAPTFTVNAGPGRFFATEIAASPELFDSSAHGDERNFDNFYASWSDAALMQGGSYTVPSSVWQRLRADDQLYYRIASSAKADDWEDLRYSSDPGEGAQVPALRIDG